MDAVLDTLPLETTFRSLDNYGHSVRAPSYVLRPSRPEEIVEAFRMAHRQGLSVTARGTGLSYNDASLNGGGIVLNLSAMNRIIDWDPSTGVALVEPGVTIEQLWKTVEPDGWWPAVVSGTMRTTMGGCAAANIHGKNNFKMGPFGEHVLEFRAILPTGAEVVCSPKKNADLFYAMIGGFGMLGIFTAIKLQTKRIYSGLLEVAARPSENLHAHLDDLLGNAPASDYIVGWLDLTIGGSSLGRGQVHAARYLHQGEDPDPKRTMQLNNQVLPPRIFGVFPKSLLYLFMRPFMTNAGARLVNTGKYITSLPRHTFRQSHAAFHFLLDYVPNVERAYAPGGLIQHQSFLPHEAAEAAWTKMIRLSQKRGLPSYLGVTKRHRPDKFLLTHALDGFSLAMDFKVTNGNRAALSQLLQDFDRIVLEAGGRFYFAKNSETRAASARQFLGAKAVAEFRRLKKRCDPNGLLESNLYRRLFA
jgi:decaprenylphospho-beta-D-ribofuranose 2-oxidase